jgi:hypothetical protein
MDLKKNGELRHRRDRTGFRAPIRLSMMLIRWGWSLLVFSAAALAQGGPPYYTNDPGTPGNHNWEINLGYMPFFYGNQSVSHVPDVDLNFGVGNRIQLTYENAWLRVQNPYPATKYGLGQSNPGVKWRFYDAGEKGWSISMFPQFFLNNPNDAAQLTWITKSGMRWFTKVRMAGSPALWWGTTLRESSKAMWNSIIKEHFIPPKFSPRSTLAAGTKSINR